MAHPIMFDEDDPLLARVRELALALPDAAEKVGHGRPTFFTTKVFAYYGGSVRRDGEWIRHDTSVLVLPDPEEAEALLAEPRAFRPAYLGPAGWVGVDLGADTDWTEVAELIETSYRRTAGARRVARLDAAPRSG
ncbi:MAG: MmcQ/YjbR family DNA-binding protein [Kineosporiaceae bacterium]